MIVQIRVSAPVQVHDERNPSLCASQEIGALARKPRTTITSLRMARATFTLAARSEILSTMHISHYQAGQMIVRSMAGLA
jgi:hypothetical protein